MVFWEHLILAVLVSPWLLPSARRLAAASLRTKASVLVIGAGSSALATALSTAAFRLGDPITPQVLQKLQPLIAIVLAALLLGERLRPRYAVFAVPALVGAWLLTFADPLRVSVSSAPGRAPRGRRGRAVGGGDGAGPSRERPPAVPRPRSAALHHRPGDPGRAGRPGRAGGAPLGRAANPRPRAAPGALRHTPLTTSPSGRTTASRATPAELAALIGVAAFGTRPTGTQWLGIVVLASVVALHERRSSRPAVMTPAPVEPQPTRR